MLRYLLAPDGTVETLSRSRVFATELAKQPESIVDSKHQVAGNLVETIRDNLGESGHFQLSSHKMGKDAGGIDKYRPQTGRGL
jgi:hypothetical protein